MIGEATSRERIALDGADRTPPTEFRIFKFGKVETTKGTFLFDDAAAKSVMAAWQSYGNDLSIDYEHRMVDPDARAGDGKAAGWFQLEVRGDGLYAVNVKWTDTAARQIAAAEWRYFSPTFDFDRKTGRVLELVNVALTNIPATKNLPALVAANRRKQMPKKDETATEELGVKKTKKTVTETTEDDAATDADDGDAATDADDTEATDESTDADDGDAATTDEGDLDEESDDETEADDDGDDDDDDAPPPPAKKKAPPPPPPKQSAKTARALAARSSLERRIEARVTAAIEARVTARLEAQNAEQRRAGKVEGLVHEAVTKLCISPAEAPGYIQGGMALGTKWLRSQLALRKPMTRKATEPDHSGPIARLSKEQVQTFARANGMAYKDALRAPELVELAKSLRPIVTVQHPGAADDADAAE